MTEATEINAISAIVSLFTSISPASQKRVITALKNGPALAKDNHDNA